MPNGYKAESMIPLRIGMVVSDAFLWHQVQAELRNLPVNIVFELAGLEDIPSLVAKVEKFSPEVLIVDPVVLPESLPDVLRGIRTAGSHCQVVVVRDRPNPEDILLALRAGAKEYLYPPFSPGLKEALERISREMGTSSVQSSQKKGQMIGFLSVKGGCGATTVACHTALEVAHRSRQETLLADFDFTAGLVRILMHATSRYSVLDAVNNLHRLDQSYWRGLVSNGYEGVEVIAATPIEVPHRTPQSTELQRVTRFIRSQYDWTIVDLGRGLDPLKLALVGDLDTLVLVTSLEMPALQMAKLMLRYISESGVAKEKVKLVINRYSKRHTLTQSDVQNVLGVDIFSLIPNDYRSLEEAYAHDRLLPEGHSIRQAISGMAARLVGSQPVQQKKKFSMFGGL